MDAVSLLVLASLLTLGTVVLAWMRNKRSRNHLPLPPGPKLLPFVGNMFDIQREKEAQTFDRWYRTYGDLLHVSVLGIHIILLNTAKAVKDLLERRSAIYSSRPQSIMMNELCIAYWRVSELVLMPGRMGFG